MDKSAIFKAAHALAKSAHKAGDCYRVTFAAALKIIIKESKGAKMKPKKVTVSMDFNSYNQRRFGKPWGARITFAGTKGKVLIECMTGDIVAFGQKDGRGNSTYNEMYLVNADGTLTNIDKQGAYEHVSK